MSYELRWSDTPFGRVVTNIGDTAVRFDPNDGSTEPFWLEPGWHYNYRSGRIGYVSTAAITPAGLPAEIRAHIELLEQQLTNRIRTETGNLSLSFRYEIDD